MGTIALGSLEIGSLLLGFIGAKVLPKVVTGSQEDTRAGLVAHIKARLAALKSAVAANKDNEDAAAVAQGNATVVYAEACLCNC